MDENLEPKDELISVKAMVVKTKNSTYRIGEADENGEREVSRDEKPLDFKRCKVTVLKIGEEMELECVDPQYPAWFTTTVFSIE